MTKLTELLSEDNFSVSELIMALKSAPLIVTYTSSFISDFSFMSKMSTTKLIPQRVYKGGFPWL